MGKIVNNTTPIIKLNDATEKERLT